ncbi:transposase, partial [Pseudoalteromonas sp. 120-MNA-CIBAN-0494]|uniref:transposase n=1 Tax=Pseudoalteromonas sp. 120-MNA-CIBAN-0494 TaxID=3140427 RepID=UPI00387EDA8C
MHEGLLKQVTKDDFTFIYKDYLDSKIKRMSLTGIEFIRRYLLHVLTSGFMRIRH